MNKIVKKEIVIISLIILLLLIPITLAGVTRTISGECPVGSTKNMINMRLTKTGTVSYYSVNEKIPKQVNAQDIIFWSSESFDTADFDPNYEYRLTGIPNSKQYLDYNLDVPPSSSFTIDGEYMFDVGETQTTIGATTVTTRSLTCQPDGNDGQTPSDDLDGDGFGYGCACPNIVDCDDDPTGDPAFCSDITSATLSQCTTNEQYEVCAICSYPIYLALDYHEGYVCSGSAADDCWGEDDGIDQDCDGYEYKDSDNDGYVDSSSGYGKGGVAGNDCCDDNDGTSMGCSLIEAPNINPGATEDNTAGENDNIDQDCNGCDFIDLDNDGYRAQGTGCGADDCNDDDSNIHPAPESFDTWCNGIDENCDNKDCCRTTNYPINNPMYYDGWPGNILNQGDVQKCNTLDNYEKAVFISYWLNGTFDASLTIVMNNIPAGYNIP